MLTLSWSDFAESIVAAFCDIESLLNVELCRLIPVDERSTIVTQAWVLAPAPVPLARFGDTVSVDSSSCSSCS